MKNGQAHWLMRSSMAALAAGLLTACGTVGEKPAKARDAAEVRARLEQWRRDFNTGRADEVCAMFAPDLRADTPRATGRSYRDLTGPLRKVMADGTRTYSYALAIREIIVTGDYAVVRLTWTLTERGRQTGRGKTSVEHGMDIFRRDRAGWRICRFMVFDS